MFSKDAKLGKKCTLLDLSRHASVAAPEAPGPAVLSSEAKDQDSSSLSKPAPDPDPSMSVEDVESNERIEEEKKDGVDKKATSELSSEESPVVMEVDPTDSRSEEQSMTE